MNRPGYRLMVGHVLEQLAELPAESVHMVVTSPPYFGLRCYPVAPQVWGGVPGCEHAWGDSLKTPMARRGGSTSMDTVAHKGRQVAVARQAAKQASGGRVCARCGAWCGNLGSEPTVALYVEHMLEVGAAIRRVLRADGTWWLNLGDSYNGSGRGGRGNEGAMLGRKAREARVQERTWRADPELKPKDLIGIPWRVALGLQGAGWYLRNEIVWHKPVCLPESPSDRLTRDHETLFLLSKSEHYYYDVDGFRRSTLARARTVWSIKPGNYLGDHAAVFPDELPRRCIKLGSSARGVCVACGAPWMRQVEAGEQDHAHARACGADALGGYDGQAQKDYLGQGAQDASATKARILRSIRKRRTVGWVPTCDCDAGEPVPATVLDPFAGSGTTLLVARALGRASVGIELAEASAAECRGRLDDVSQAEPVAADAGQFGLFGGEA